MKHLKEFSSYIKESSYRTEYFNNFVDDLQKELEFTKYNHYRDGDDIHLHFSPAPHYNEDDIAKITDLIKMKNYPIVLQLAAVNDGFWQLRFSPDSTLKAPENLMG